MSSILTPRADIKANNIMLTVDDDSVLTDFEKAEHEEPTPRKVIDENRTIYASRKFRSPNEGLWGEPVLCDFGRARIGKTHRGDAQPQIYKAPEVLFEMEWSYSIDIWNVGVMVRTPAWLTEIYLSPFLPPCSNPLYSR